MAVVCTVRMMSALAGTRVRALEQECEIGMSAFSSAAILGPKMALKLTYLTIHNLFHADWFDALGSETLHKHISYTCMGDFTVGFHI